MKIPTRMAQMGPRGSAWLSPWFALALAALGCGEADGGDLTEGDVEEASSALAIQSATLWPPSPSGLTRILTCFVSSASGTQAEREHVRITAEGLWEPLGAHIVGPNGRYGVDFTGWGICPTNTAGMIPISFVSGSINATTNVGREITAMKLIRNPPADAIVHEFGHALGYEHEFRRSDYAAVDPACLQVQGDRPDIAITPVDRPSIMNYPACGGQGVLSAFDVTGHMNVYGPADITYGSLVAIRSEPTWNFAVLALTPNVALSTIENNSRFRLVDPANPRATGGQIKFGSSVRIQAAGSGQFLKSNGRGALTTQTFITDATVAWKVRGDIAAGQPLRVNDRVRFEASDGALLQVGELSRLNTGAGAWFRVIRLGTGGLLVTPP